MGNKSRGIYDLKYEGNLLQIHVNHNSIAEIESHFNKTVDDVARDLQSRLEEGKFPRSEDIIYLLWSCLHEADESVSIKEAGKILSSYGMIEFILLFLEAVRDLYNKSEQKESSKSKQAIREKKTVGQQETLVNSSEVPPNVE